MKTIYTHTEEVKNVSKFIYDNLSKCYLGSKNGNSYYNVDGIVWEVWQSGCGNYPKTNNTKIEDFKIN